MTGNVENRGRNIPNGWVTDLQNSARNWISGFSLRLAARIFGEQIASYGIWPRLSELNALFIEVKKNAFFKSTLQRKVTARSGVLRYQFHQLIRRQRQHAEHQVRHHFGRTSHPHVPP